VLFFFSSRRRHTRCLSDWSSDVCSSDLRGVADRIPSVNFGNRMGGHGANHGVNLPYSTRIGRVVPDIEHLPFQLDPSCLQLGNFCERPWLSALESTDQPWY